MDNYFSTTYWTGENILLSILFRGDGKEFKTTDPIISLNPFIPKFCYIVFSQETFYIIQILNFYAKSSLQCFLILFSILSCYIHIHIVYIIPNIAIYVSPSLFAVESIRS